jgi:phosphoribosylanthranilate isomerase
LRIKICGLFRDEDVSYINEAKPDYAGFVFAESARQVDARKAGKLRRALADGIESVGVFVNAEPETVRALYADGVIGLAQLHGGEDEVYIARLKGICGARIIKTVRCSGLNALPEYARGGFGAETAADFLLFDSGGGSGERFNWRLLDFAGGVGPARPWFLAGGITEDNITEAALLKPFCIDVSSGAESGGFKDREKILRLVEAARKAIS